MLLEFREVVFGRIDSFRESFLEEGRLGWGERIEKAREGEDEGG